MTREVDNQGKNKAMHSRRLIWGKSYDQSSYKDCIEELDILNLFDQDQDQPQLARLCHFVSYKSTYLAHVGIQ